MIYLICSGKAVSRFLADDLGKRFWKNCSEGLEEMRRVYKGATAKPQHAIRGVF